MDSNKEPTGFDQKLNELDNRSSSLVLSINKVDTFQFQTQDSIVVSFRLLVNNSTFSDVVFCVSYCVDSEFYKTTFRRIPVHRL